MDALYVNKNKISQDNHGWYVAKDLCQQLFPGDKKLQKKALLCSYAESIDNLSDFIGRVAKRCNVNRKDLFSKLCFTRPVSPEKFEKRSGGGLLRPRPNRYGNTVTWKQVMKKNSEPPKEWGFVHDNVDDDIVLPEDRVIDVDDPYAEDPYMDFDDERDSDFSSLSLSRDKDKEGEKKKKDEEEEEEEKGEKTKSTLEKFLDLSSLSSPSSSPRIERFKPRPVAGKKLPVRAASYANVNRLVTFEDRIEMLNANSRALHALAQLLSAEPGNTAWRDEIQSVALPFVDSIKKLGPVEDSHTKFMPAPRPEKPGDPLFGASERARALGMNPDRIKVAQVGKEALQLYKDAYSPHVPLRRKTQDARGNSYFMNVYSEESARNTLDVALRDPANLKKNN
jgi:prophage antirepressor-like protein